MAANNLLKVVSTKSRPVHGLEPGRVYEMEKGPRLTWLLTSRIVRLATAADEQPKPKPAPAKAESVATDSTGDFDGFTSKELRAYAKDNGIKIPAGVTKKSAIIEILEAE